MRKRERYIVGKYYQRATREFARHELWEVFAFMKSGAVPKGYARESRVDVTRVREAIRDVLESTYDGNVPLPESIAAFEDCINWPVMVIGKKPSKESLKTLADCLNRPARAKCKERELLKGDPKDIRKGILNRKLCTWQFTVDCYFRRLADLLTRCLTEYHKEIFLFGPLLGRCQWKDCKRLFLKAKTNQQCCSRECGRKFDYNERLKKDPSYYRKKSAEYYGYPIIKRKYQKRRNANQKG